MERYRISQDIYSSLFSGTSYVYTIYDRLLDFEIRGNSNYDMNRAKDDAWDLYYTYVREHGDGKNDSDDERDENKTGLQTSIPANLKESSNNYIGLYRNSSSFEQFFRLIFSVNLSNIPDNSFSYQGRIAWATTPIESYVKKGDKVVDDIYEVLKLNTIEVWLSGEFKWIHFLSDKLSSVESKELVHLINAFVEINGSDDNYKGLLSRDEINNLKNYSSNNIRQWTNHKLNIQFMIDKSSNSFKITLPPVFFI